jgi:hypothetical protein
MSIHVGERVWAARCWVAAVTTDVLAGASGQSLFFLGHIEGAE